MVLRNLKFQFTMCINNLDIVSANFYEKLHDRGSACNQPKFNTLTNIFCQVTFSPHNHVVEQIQFH